MTNGAVRAEEAVSLDHRAISDACPAAEKYVVTDTSAMLEHDEFLYERILSDLRAGREHRIAARVGDAIESGRLYGKVQAPPDTVEPYVGHRHVDTGVCGGVDLCQLFKRHYGQAMISVRRKELRLCAERDYLVRTVAAKVFKGDRRRLTRSDYDNSFTVRCYTTHARYDNTVTS